MSFLRLCPLLPSFLLYPVSLDFSDLFPSPPLYLSSHLSKPKDEEKKEKQMEYAGRKLLSHTVQKGDNMWKIQQRSLITQ